MGTIKKKTALGTGSILFALVVVCLVLFIYQYQVLGDTIEQERITYVTEIKSQLVNNIITEKKIQMSAVSLYCQSILKARPEHFSDLEDILEGAQMDEGDKIFLLDETGVLYDLHGRKKILSNSSLVQRLLLERTSVFSYGQVNNSDEYWFYGAPFEGVVLDGVPIRAVISARSLHNFGSRMATSILDNKGYTYVTAQTGNVLVFPPQENDMGYNLFNSLQNYGASVEALGKMREDFQEGRDGQRFLSYKNNRWLISYSTDIFDDWVVVVLMPMTITAADTYRMLSYTMMTVALLVGSILALMLFLINLFYRRERIRERAVQQEKLRLEVAQRTAESKNQFLAKMSHDIRTPLNAIMGLLQIARGQVSGQTKVEENLSQASQSAEYLLSILNDILDMSKIESGKMQLSCVPFSMETLLETVEAINHAQASEKELDFRVERQGSLSPYYLGDPLRIKQVLMNLLSNAIKFTDYGGLVLLRLTVTPGTGEEDQLDFVVEDTGIGMSEEYMKNLFRPFEQESPNISLSHAGSGLGLSIVKNLVELMGGSIRVSSVKGKGSRFEVSLRLERAEQPECAEGEREGDTGISLEGRRLLLVEDNELNAMIASELISSQCGMQVDRAENGLEAVERFTAGNGDEYASILMDIRMPVMDGLEAAAAIRNSGRPRAGSIPIIAMSANAFQEDVALSLQSGMNAHLSKPIDIGKLEKIMKIYIEKEEASCIETKC